MESCHWKSELHLSSTEAQVARIGMELQDGIVHSPQPYRVPYQAVLLLEQGTAAAGFRLPPVPLVSKQLYNITLSPPP